MYVKNFGFNGPDNDMFSISLNKNKMYTINSTDNTPYDFVFNPLNITSRYRSNCIEVLIEDKFNYEEKKIILINPGCIILDNSDLIITIGNNIYILDCYSFLVRKFEIFDAYPDFFKDQKSLRAIYKIWDGYVIELNTGSEFIPQLIKFSHEFKQEWKHYSHYGCSVMGIYGENIKISTLIGEYLLDKFGKEIHLK